MEEKKLLFQFGEKYKKKSIIRTNNRYNWF